MNYIREKFHQSDYCLGMWCNMGSSLSVEMISLIGFDWALIDLEHGPTDQDSLLHLLQPLSNCGTAPIVRIAWNDPVRFKRTLDLGVSGVMVPYVNTAEEAEMAVKAMRYPPEGIRGASYTNRATGFGMNYHSYYKKANDSLLTIVQIETEEAVSNSSEIAGVAGVDVLFVGPLDLSISLGVAGNYDSPIFTKALEKVQKSADQEGKKAGILVSNEKMLKDILGLGFTFIAYGSDSGLLVNGMKKNKEIFDKSTLSGKSE